MSTPLLVSDSITLPSGGAAVTNSARLSSPFRQAIVIDEIRWSTYNNLLNFGNVWNAWPSMNAGGVIRTKLSIGRVDLTNGFVPMWLFGTAMQQPRLAETMIVDVTGADTFAHKIVVSNYRWKLPKPLYLAPGNSLQSAFQHVDTTVNMGDTTVHVAYAGRYATPEDAPRGGNWEVPWVTAYLPAPNQVHVQTSEGVLGNPFLVPLNVQRMLFRALLVGPYQCQEVATTSLSAYLPAQVVLKDSHGVNVIRDAIDPSIAFDAARRAWTFQTVLNPKEQYHATFMGMVDNSRDYDSYVQLAMVGWRNERIA